MPTGIEWTDETWNPTTGCTKLSAGCKNCYAKREWERLKHNPRGVYYGREFEDIATHPERLDWPVRWSRPRRIFVDSMSDLFHERIPDPFITQVMDITRRCPQHVFQILTKRAERMWAYFEQHPTPGANVMLGVSAEDQLSWDERVPYLLSAKVPGRFVSLEPLLGMIDMRGALERKNRDTHVVSVPPIRDWPVSFLDMVIVGGESGPEARPTHPKWVRWLRDQCLLAETPFFFKQWGEWLPDGQQMMGVVAHPTKPGRVRIHTFGEDGQHVRDVGKKSAGRLLDGCYHDGQDNKGLRARWAAPGS